MRAHARQAGSLSLGSSVYLIQTDWVELYVSRHAELSARRPSSTTKQEWFTLLLCQIIMSV